MENYESEAIIIISILYWLDGAYEAEYLQKAFALACTFFCRYRCICISLL